MLGWHRTCTFGDRRLLDRDRLGQVTRLVHVRAARDGDMVGEQLERDDGEDRAERLVGVRDPADIVREMPSSAIRLTRQLNAQEASMVSITSRRAIVPATI